MSVPEVAVVILNWNNAPDTIACLASVGRLDYPSTYVVVVDNGSTDGSVDRIRRAHPSIPIVETGQNLGYAAGNNVGLGHALARGVDYVCVLNNDTILAPDALTMLVREAEGDPVVGIAGPKMYFLDPDNMIFAAGSWIDWNRGTIQHRGFGRRERIAGELFATGPEDVDFIIGCCVLLRRRVIEEIGLLDPRYYLNFEDVDWCVRAKQAGYQVRYVPQAVLWHRVSATLGQASPQNTYYMTRNALLFFGSHLAGWRRLRAVSNVVWRNIGHVAAWTIKQEYRRTARAKRDATLLALRDALLRRFGKMGTDVEVICQNNCP